MTNQKILEKAIKKAINNGWNISSWEQKTDLLLSCENNLYLMSDYDHYPLLIFSHDFAKAFWGNETHNYETGCEGFCWNHNFRCGADPYTKTEYCWQHQLHQMVLCEEPLKYLEKFL